jgi:hypothetical protein
MAPSIVRGGVPVVLLRGRTTVTRRISDVDRERMLQSFIAEARAFFDRSLRHREESGPATFDQIESTAMESCRSMARQFMQQLVEVEEADEGETASCPVCRRACSRKGPPQKRTVLTEAGRIEFSRREFYCKPCRRAFFPSGLGAGLWDRRVQPERSPQD